MRRMRFASPTRCPRAQRVRRRPTLGYVPFPTPQDVSNGMLPHGGFPLMFIISYSIAMFVYQRVFTTVIHCVGFDTKKCDSLQRSVYVLAIGHVQLGHLPYPVYWNNMGFEKLKHT